MIANLFVKEVWFFTILLVWTFPCAASAYVGPGGGLSAIGAFLAIVAGIVVAIFGFLWYPIKRLVKKIKKKQTTEGDD